MIRWRFVVTRLIVIVAIVYILGLGLGPVARYATITIMQHTVGAKVEIENADVGFFPPRVSYRTVAIADPRDDKSMRNAVSADRIELTIDGNALLHRRWVASSGSITGLQVGGQRDDTGHFDAEVETIDEQSDEPSVLSQWLADATGGLAEGVQGVGDDLETVRRSREIRASWQRQYDQAIADAKDVHRRINELRDRARGIDNPLRDWEQLRQALAEADATRKRLFEVREELDNLPAKFQDDFASMEEARRIDLQKIDQFVPGDLSGADKLGVDLVRDAIAAQVARVRSYIDNGKAIADYTIVAPEDNERHRGRTYDLSLTKRPEILIRRCEISGQLRNGGDLYNVSGIVRNLTPTPETLDEPTRARLRLEGPDTLRLDYVRDRRDGIESDLVTLHWPNMDAGEMRLGKRGGTRIDVTGGRRELWVQINLAGDNVDGRLVSKQTGVSMDLALDGDLSDSIAAKSLDDSLQMIDRIEVNAEFSGTWKELDIDLQTNLGKALRLAAKEAVAGQFAASKQDLADRIAVAQAEESARLREWIASHQGEAQSLLAEADSTIEQMRQKIVSEIGDVDYIGRLGDAFKKKF